jgi:hypothetical protein
MPCESFAVSEITFKSASESQGVNYVDRWAISGGTGLDRGDVVIYGTLPEGWTEASHAQRIDPENEVVYVTLRNGGEVTAAVFKIGSLTDDWSTMSGDVEPAGCGTSD